MFEPRLMWVLGLLLVILIVTARLARLGPRSAAQWQWVWGTLVFLLWLLAGFQSLRA
jgi:formate hydrogenlyase subunit 4